MSWLDGLAGRFGYERAQNATPLPAITRGSDMWEAFVGNMGGLPVPTEKTAMTVSAIYACVNLIAGAIASLPMQLYDRRADGELLRRQNDDLWWILNEQFLPRWSAANGWEYLVQSLLFHGDAFAKIKRNGSRVIGIEPVHPNRVTVAPSADGMRLVYAILDDPALTIKGEKVGYEVLDQDDVLHVAGFGFDGCRSLSPLRNHLRMTGAVALATQDYSARFFSNGARPDILLSTDQKIDSAQAEGLREQWKALYGGTENRGKVAVLGSGTKLQTITMPNDDAQLIATRQFQIEEIARVYGVPPFMIGHTEKTTSWGSGVETMGQGFVRFTLSQHLNKFTNEINRKFFRTASRVAEFDTFELEKADMKSLFEAMRTALGRAGEPGFLTTDEVRAKIKYGKTPGGDKLQTGASNAPEQTPEPAAE